MQLFPTKIFYWANPKDFNLDNYSNNIPIVCLLEFDLDYSEELHDLHNNYPLVGQKVKVTEEMLSQYQLQIIDNNNFSLGKNKRLVPNLGNKRKHKLHYQNLKLYFHLDSQLKNSIEY